MMKLYLLSSSSQLFSGGYVNLQCPIFIETYSNFFQCFIPTFGTKDFGNVTCGAETSIAP